MMSDSAPVESRALVVRGDGDVCQGIDGTQKSKVWVHSLFDPDENMVRPPGFEPGLRAWKARIITRLDYGRSRRETTVSGCDLRVLIKWTKLGRSVEGWHHYVRASSHLPVSNRSVEGLHHILMERFPFLFVPTGQWKASILMGEALSLLSSMVSGRL